MILSPDEVRRRVLYRDDDLFVFDKPSGLAVHKGTATRHDLEQFLPALCQDGEPPPRLAHRLDKDTSGCLLLGRHDTALARLGTLFAHHHIEKLYWALVQGGPEQDQGRIDQPIRKLPGPEGDRMRPAADAPPALTLWRVLGRANGLCWLELSPQTGRTHQLRAHCALSGWPILGDRLYGQDNASPLQLHARQLRFQLYRQTPEILVQAPPPEHMERMMQGAAPYALG